MRILITNDDGINAPGLKVLEAIATEIAGPDGEVWTVAPAFEQSGVGHCISYTNPMMVSELAPRRYAIEGSPADCVLAAISEIMPERPDLILSGINRGNNAAENTLYSGTIGAAMEAALQNLPAIAMSQYYGVNNARLENSFEAASEHGTQVGRTLLDHGVWGSEAGYHLFYNVNFPPCPAQDVKGMKVAAQGFRTETYFGTKPFTSPSGRKYLWITGGPQDVKTAPGTDAAVNLDGYISLTPMRADLTAHDVVDLLKMDIGE